MPPLTARSNSRHSTCLSSVYANLLERRIQSIVKVVWELMPVSFHKLMNRWTENHGLNCWLSLCRFVVSIVIDSAEPPAVLPISWLQFTQLDHLEYPRLDFPLPHLLTKHCLCSSAIPDLSSVSKVIRITGSLAFSLPLYRPYDCSIDLLPGRSPLGTTVPSSDLRELLCMITFSSYYSPLNLVAGPVLPTPQ